MDFLPRYVYTILSNEFKQSTHQIIIIGQDNGKIYGKYDNKKDLIDKVENRKTRNYMMCYYKENINFDKKEMETLWRKNIFPISKKEADKIKIKIINNIF